MSKKEKEHQVVQKYSVYTFFTQIFVFVYSALTLAPLYIILSYSFKTKKEIYTGNPLVLPKSFNFENYTKAFDRLNLPVTFFNTLSYTIISVIILAFVCGSAAWAIARNKGKLYKFLYLYFIIGILIPGQALFLQIYTIGNVLGLVNTRFGIIFIYVATNISFGVFLMTSFMNTIPIELEEAAKIDGCSVYRTYFSIVLPLLKPAMATLIIMQSFQIWNEYLMTSLFVSDKNLRTITIAMQGLFSQQSSDYSVAFASITISALPIIILFIAFQKYFIKGMTVGAVKG